jgi:hypothetical protein
MTETFTCPRRVQDGMDREDSPFRHSGSGLDEWRDDRAGLVNQPRGCSYCGSLPPEDFMEAVRAGLEVGPTDKSYKFYVKGIPIAEPKLRCSASSNRKGAGYRAYGELTRAEKRAVKDAGHGKTHRRDHYYGGFVTETSAEAKFYTMHLSREQGWEFDELNFTGKVNWGYPGYAYTRLYIPGPSNPCTCPEVEVEDMRSGMKRCSKCLGRISVGGGV